MLKLSRYLIGIAILIGCVFSVSSGAKLQQLKQDNRELLRQTET